MLHISVSTISTRAFSGPVHTLRILKRDVTEVKKGSECGLSLEKFSDLQEGDFIQMFQEIERPAQLF